ncbi:MAG: GTPase ObgE [Thermovirgaceae bacterium]|nr:GTPase ObgE [Thermovirgaceae bacterium]
MRFLDVVKIFVQAGKAGNGSLSFRREKFVPRGGPDGGDGGRGGHIFFVADERLQTLADFEYRHRFLAGDGTHGKGGKRHGASGEDTIVTIPCGTIVIDPVTGEVLADLTVHGDSLLVARGGKGGRGNARFASSRRNAPRFSEMGGDGETRDVRLELKMLADVGLIGLPNAGKSTLLSAISNSRPEIAGYPFTTISPNLGMLAVDNERIIIADVPGLIEGAHQNKGLGHAFLRHIERTRLLVYVIDLSEESLVPPIEQWSTLRSEFNEFNTELLGFPSVVAGNKIDLPCSSSAHFELENALSVLKIPFFSISALAGEGISEFIRYIASVIQRVPKPQREKHSFEIEDVKHALLKREKPLISKVEGEDGVFVVNHSEVERLIKRFNFEQDEALGRFTALMRHYRIEDLLIARGAREGDTVKIGDIEFDFLPETASPMEEGSGPVEGR